MTTPLSPPPPLPEDPLSDYPPMDGRDVSRVRTELRLAQLALIGLITEEQESPPGSGTHSRVLRLLQQAEEQTAQAVEALGHALVALAEEHGGGPE